MLKPVRMGIEVEYLITTASGKPICSGYGLTRAHIPRTKGLQILKRAARSIDSRVCPKEDQHGHVRWDFKDGSAIMPDTFSLLETVTGPSTDLDELRDQLWTMKSALIKAAGAQKCTVSGAACPVSYKYGDIRSNADTRCNNAGMHIHLEALNDEVKVKFANMLAQVIPELAALGSNSSVYNRNKSQYASKRLSVSPLVGAKAVTVYTYDRDNPIQLDDPRAPSWRYRFVTMFSKGKKTVELRGFDTPMSIDWVMAIAAVIQSLAVKATRLFIVAARNTVVSNTKTLRGKNYDAAVRSGLGARFVSDRTTHMKVHGKSQSMSFLYHNRSVDQDKKVSAALAVKRLLYYVEQEAYELGLIGYLDPIYAAVKAGKSQAQRQHDWFDARGFNGFLTRLQQASGQRPQNAKRSGGTRRKYFTVRQRVKTAKKEGVYLTDGGMRKAGVKEGDTVTVSGPLDAIQMVVRQDRTRSDTIPLGDDELRMGRRFRNQFGVSMYDPVIIGADRIQPIVMEKTDEKWAFTPSGTAAHDTRAGFVVQKGITRFSPHIVLNPKDAEALDVEDGGTLTAVAPDGKKGDVAVSTLRELRRGVVAMMQKTRKELGVDIGASVTLQKPSDARDADSMRLTVRHGDKDDIGADMPVVRVHSATLQGLGLSDGDTALARVATDAGKISKRVVVKKDSKGLRRQEAGLVKAAREALGVELAGTLALRAGSG